MDHHPCRPNLTVRGSHLFGFLNKRLFSKRFTRDSDVKQDVTTWLQTLDTGLFYVGIEALAPR
jgi:hypothetical protein